MQPHSSCSMYIKKHSGLSLIELMIGIFVGIIVVAGAIKTYSGSTQSGSDITNVNQLNQDLRSMMDVMVHEIRRAGFITSPQASTPLPLQTILQNNSFANLNIDKVTINIKKFGETKISSQTFDDACIIFMYHKSNSSIPILPIIVPNNEHLGFKMWPDTDDSRPVLKIWKGGANNLSACSSGTNWETITPRNVEITELRFDLGLGEEKLNVTQRQNNPSSSPSTICNPGDKCLFIHTVTITLTGVLADGQTQTLFDIVKIRNNQYCHKGYASLSPAQCNP